MDLPTERTSANHRPPQSGLHPVQPPQSVCHQYFFRCVDCGVQYYIPNFHVPIKLFPQCPSGAEVEKLDIFITSLMHDHNKRGLTAATRTFYTKEWELKKNH